MSSQFVFSVDTDEVATTVAPPTPVIAAPRRRTMARRACSFNRWQRCQWSKSKLLRRCRR